MGHTVYVFNKKYQNNLPIVLIKALYIEYKILIFKRYGIKPFDPNVSERKLRHNLGRKVTDFLIK